jgi:hypothetical protein
MKAKVLNRIRKVYSDEVLKAHFKGSTALACNEAKDCLEHLSIPYDIALKTEDEMFKRFVYYSSSLYERSWLAMKPFFMGSTSVMNVCCDAKRGTDRKKHLPNKKIEENKVPRICSSMGDFGERLAGEILHFFDLMLYKCGKICWDELPNCGVTPDYIITSLDKIFLLRQGIGDLGHDESRAKHFLELLKQFWDHDKLDLYSFRSRPKVKGVVEVKTTTVYQDQSVDELYTADEWIRKLINDKHECLVGEEKIQSWMPRDLHMEFKKNTTFQWEAIVETNGPHEDNIPTEAHKCERRDIYTKYKIPAGAAKLRLTVGSIGRQVFSEMMGIAQFAPDDDDIMGKLCFLQYRSPNSTPSCCRN